MYVGDEGIAVMIMVMGTTMKRKPSLIEMEVMDDEEGASDAPSVGCTTTITMG